MDAINDFFTAFSSFLWGWPMIILLLGTHIFLTIRLRFPQRKIFKAIKLSVKKDKNATGDVSQFRALATALAATINYLVFDIVSAEYHNQLYCQIQNRYNLSKVKVCDEYIYHHQSFISNLHQKTSGYGRVQYNTICSYIRNAIDHFDNGHTYTEDELIQNQ